MKSITFLLLFTQHKILGIYFSPIPICPNPQIRQHFYLTCCETVNELLRSPFVWYPFVRQLQIFQITSIFQWTCTKFALNLLGCLIVIYHIWIIHLGVKFTPPQGSRIKIFYYMKMFHFSFNFHQTCRHIICLRNNHTIFESCKFLLFFIGFHWTWTQPIWASHHHIFKSFTWV